ncbi:MAG: heme peroxidase family protein [Pseudomonadota bacterium]
MTKHHGMAPLKGMAAHCKRGHEVTRDDRFGRMFPSIPPAYVPADVLREVGRAGGPMDGGATATRTKSVPVGHVFFGQFVDHDITLDASSSFTRVNNPAETPNVRTPTLDLDCIYGAGPESHPYLFVDDGGPFSGAKLLTGADMPSTGDSIADAHQAEDLMRGPHGRAIIGDHRNDENRVISQMQLGVIRFHNLMCDKVHAATGHTGAELYEEARLDTTWHYQWGVVNDFLVTMCGDAVVSDILACGRRFYCPLEPHIPIEFAVAAYRFGHSMVPMALQVQSGGGTHELFGPVLGEGFKPISNAESVIDWSQLFFEPTKTGVQRAEKLDTTMAGDLLALPFVAPPGEASLATRNLLRGNSFLLPAGEKVAEEMGRSEKEIEDVVKAVSKLSDKKITEGVPLWLYLLAEAEEIGRETKPGKFDSAEGLGPVGARIVAEVMIGLLELDDNSFLGSNRNWLPEADYDTVGKILTKASPA